MCGPSSVLSQVNTSTPSRRTLPLAAGHKPTNRRANVVLPEADGPTTASTSPGCRANATPRRIGICDPGAAATTFSTASAPCGAGKDIPAGRTGKAASNWSSRLQASRTFTTACHCDTICTSGASTRPPSIDAMIIMAEPPLSSLRSISQAPRPRSIELVVFCKNLEAA